MINVDAHSIVECETRVVSPDDEPFIVLKVITKYGQVNIYPATYRDLDSFKNAIAKMENAVEDNPNLLRR